MHRITCTGQFLALAVALAGCGKKDEPAPAGSGMDTLPRPGGGGGAPGLPPDLGKPPTNEDPEVAAYFKQKGWTLMRDVRISDRKPLMYLAVESKALGPDDVKMIAKSKALQVLNLASVACTDDVLKGVAGIPQMEGIIVNGEEVTDAGVKALAASKSLDNVTLFSTKKVTDAGIKELAALPKLQALNLSFLSITGSAFEAFAGPKPLTALTLDYADGLTDDGIKTLGKVTSLKELKIKTGFGQSKLTGAGIGGIVDGNLPARFEFPWKLLDDTLLASLLAKNWYPVGSLSSGQKPATTPEEVGAINLEGSAVTDKGFEPLLKCVNAKYLFLQKTKIGDATFKKLGGFTKLEYLSLEKTPVTAAGLEAVTGSPIKHLAMEGCTLTEDSFKAIGKMTNLEELWLSDAKMTADWLKHLSALPKLKQLNLMNADFDDAAVKHVVGLPSLQELTLNNTKLGDTGFQELIKMPKLKSLLVDNTKVTKDVYQKAKKENPKLGLYFYRYDIK